MLAGNQTLLNSFDGSKVGLVHSRYTSGDVLVYVIKNNTFYVIKRCIGVPGDVIYIKNDSIFLNNRYYQEQKTVKQDYSIYAANKKAFFDLLDTLQHIGKLNRSDGNNSLTTNLTIDEADHFRKSGILKLSTALPNQNIVPIFTIPQIVGWTKDNMGSLTVPKKGMLVRLSLRNFSIYNKAISEYEHVKLAIRNGRIYLDNRECNTYVFKNDYYFFMGDNREKSFDSRFEGFIPENKIVGKAKLILFSERNGNIDWNRLMKIIN